MDKKEIVSLFLKKNYLVSPDIFEFSSEIDNSLDFLEKNIPNKVVVVNKDVLISLNNLDNSFEDWKSFEDARVLQEKGRDNDSYINFIKKLNKNNFKEPVLNNNFSSLEKNIIKPSIKILTNFIQTERKIKFQDFLDYFKTRYRTLREILLKRQELQDTISISKVLNKKDKEKVAVIGMLMSKNITKNDNFILELEDLTGVLKIIVGKRNNELYNTCKEIMLDETLGIMGSFSKGVLFAERIIFPDIPLTTKSYLPGDRSRA